MIEWWGSGVVWCGLRSDSEIFVSEPRVLGP